VTTNGWSSEEFRQKIIAQLGMDPSVDDDAILARTKDLVFKKKIVDAGGMAGVRPDDPAFWDKCLARIEAANATKRAREVRLHESDRKAIDSAVAAASPEAIAQERQVLDTLGLPVAQTPPPVLLSKGTNVEDYSPEQHYNRFLKMLGGQFAPFAGPLPAGDSWYVPSPNDVVEFKDGRWTEKNPYREVP
jgi:hypothetical protein